MAIDAAERRQVARVYAEALLQVADEGGAAASGSVLEELEALTAGFETEPELYSLFASPLVDVEERAELLERSLRGRCADVLVDTLQVMNQKGRLGLVRELAVTARELDDAARGITAVRVVSARALEAAEEEQVRRAAERFTGGTVRLEQVVDPELIAGVVLYVGDRKLDLSLQRELEESANLLAERISQEMQIGAARFVEESGI